VAEAARQQTILVVEDEVAVRTVLRDGLVAAGYAVREADGRVAMLERLAADAIDLITLDVGLGDENGLELAREVRSVRNLPIVMITARGEPFDRVLGLESGADDYIVKPFYIEEVLIRIDKVLQRYRLELGAAGATRPHRVAIDHSVLDILRREYRRNDGTLVELTDIEFRLLQLFVSQPERVLSREELMQHLKGQEWSPFDRTIDGHVARLRRKIEPLGDTPQLIKSVRGVGYVFTGSVTAA
jgi:two-component system phosphate regulon response regulator OmpR